MVSAYKKIKITASASFALLCASVFAAPHGISSAESDMMSAYSSGFYPGVVRSADEILKEETPSVFTAKALVLKGEALARLGRPYEAIQTLEKSERIIDKNSRLDCQRLYWTGRALYETGQCSLASQSFFKAAQSCAEGGFANEKESVYARSILYLGKTRQILGDYEGAVRCLEFAAENGERFTMSEYEEGFVGLCDCALLSGDAAKTVRYASLIEVAGFRGFSEDSKYKVLLLKGQALESQKEYLAAYNAYIQVLSSGPLSLAASAMQKAYIISSAHRKEVGQEPGAVLAKAQELKSKEPLLVSEFWTRLAIDAFNSQDYTRSLEYFKNADDEASLEQRQTALLYTCEIGFATSAKNQSDAAKDCLDLLESSWNRLGFEDSGAFYAQAMALRARYSGLCGDYSNSYKYAKTVIESKDINAETKKASAYWAALSLYNLGEYEQAASLAKEHGEEDSSFMIIRAKSLAKSGNLAESVSIFSLLAGKNALDNEGKLDFARTLLNSGKLEQAAEAAGQAEGAEASYIQGISYFNMREWTRAEPCFKQAASGKTLGQKYSDLALFYLGYCQYQLGEYSQAAASLKSFAENGRQNALDWQAYMTAARALVQTGRYSEASYMADGALSSAKDEEQIQQGVLLSAGIYSDSAQYDKAVDVLGPYSAQRNAFGLQCRYMEAQILVKKKDYEQADRLYASLSSEKTAPAIAEEAAFRRGELFYANKDYGKAAPLFEDYIRKYRGGQFYSASLYFGADSLARTGDNGRAVLYFQQLADSKDSSTYKYGAEKQLVSLYSADGDYSAALKMAQRMTEEYSGQASIDGIDETIRQLKALIDGADSRVLAMESEYEKAGGENTFEGRKTGTELAELYFERGGEDGKAQSLALRLLEKQRKIGGESAWASRNAMLLARSYRVRGDNKGAAEMFLETAQLARKAGDDESASRALYGAAEAFDAAGLKADSKASAESLMQLYPDSKYAKDALIFID